MCGIAGTIGGSFQVVETILKELNHRGPDHRGIRSLQSANIGMVRLSIIGLENGQQPIVDNNEENALIYNGEIFNFKELQKYLNKKYHLNIKTDSDTHILHQGLKAEGSDFVSKIDGMFSFCFIDQVSQKAFLSVDKLGIKQLYYSIKDDCLIFSSEITNTFRELVGAEISNEGLSEYLSFGFTAQNSINQNISKVKSGELIEYDLLTRKITSSTYLSKNCKPEQVFDGNFSSNSSNCTSLRQAVIKSVEQWCTSDVPISLSLSSGIDSGVIAIALAELGMQSNISTITLDVEGAGVSETELSQPLVDYLGLERRSHTLTQREYSNTLPKIIANLDEPYFGSYISWWIYNNCDEKVVLTGSGGDELFGNYNKRLYAQNLIYRIKNSIRSKLFTASELNFNDIIHCYTPYYGMESIVNNYLPQKSYIGKSFDAQNESWANFLRKLDIGFQLKYEFLYMTDRFSMQNSIEARVPLLGDISLSYISQSGDYNDVFSGEYKSVLLGAFPELKKYRISKEKLGFTDGKNWLKEFMDSFIIENKIALNSEQSKLNPLKLTAALNNNWISDTNKDLVKMYNIWQFLKCPVK